MSDFKELYSDLAQQLARIFKRSENVSIDSMLSDLHYLKSNLQYIRNKEVDIKPEVFEMMVRNELRKLRG